MPRTLGSTDCGVAVPRSAASLLAAPGCAAASTSRRRLGDDTPIVPRPILCSPGRARTLAGVTTALLTDHYELTMVGGRAAGRHRRPALRLRGVRPAAAAGPPLRRGRRHRPAGRAARRFRFDAGELDVLRRTGVVDEPTADWLADYRFTGDIDGYAEGELFFPGSPILTVCGTLRRVRGAGDAGAVGAQPRLRGRRRGGPDGHRRPRPAADRDGLAAHPRGGRGRRGPRRLPRRFRGHLQPRGRPALRHPDRRHRGARVHAAARRRAAGVRRPGRRAGQGHHAAGRHLRHRQGIRNAIAVAGPDLGADPDRLRRPAVLAAQSRDCSTRSARPTPRSSSPATSTSTRSPRSPPSRSTSTAPAPPWSPAPARRPPAWSTSWSRWTAGRWSSARAQGHHRRPQDGGTPAQAHRHRHRGGRRPQGVPHAAGPHDRLAAGAAGRAAASRSTPADAGRVAGAPAGGLISIPWEGLKLSAGDPAIP